jgi:hypothetical protein
MKTFNVACLVVFLSACSSSRGVEVEHEAHSPCTIVNMKVHVELRAGRPVVRVLRDCAGSAPALVHEISISDHVSLDRSFNEEGMPQLPPPHCVLGANSIRSGDGDFPAAGWEYGAAMAGYTLSRPCQSLPPGRRYYALVIGNGVGGAVFDIAADGGLNVVEEDCGSEEKARRDRR